MKEFKDLADFEKRLIISNANIWNGKHPKHVADIRVKDEYCYPPSGSDMWHPELWKGGHWNWLMTSSHYLGLKKNGIERAVEIIKEKP